MALMIVDDNMTEELLESIRRAGPGNIIYRQPQTFQFLQEPGEIYPFGDRLMINHEPYDDGGGAAICRARFGV